MAAAWDAFRFTMQLTAGITPLALKDAAARLADIRSAMRLIVKEGGEVVELFVILVVLISERGAMRHNATGALSAYPNRNLHEACSILHSR